MARRDADGKLVRPPRPDVPAVDLGDLDSLIDGVRFWLDRGAELAGYCMTDNLGNDGVVRDCHDMIGALSAAMAGLYLVERKANEHRPVVDGTKVRCDACRRWVPHNGIRILDHGRHQGRGCVGSFRPLPEGDAGTPTLESGASL